MSDSVGIHDIYAAQARIEGLARVTPLLESPFLNRIAGRRVLVKAECLQRTGSFKFRGAWSAISALEPKLRSQGVIAYSSGNHAQGIAHAAELMGCPAVIIMPEDAPALKIANTRAHGAEIVLYNRAGGESREDIGQRLCKERGLILVRPYDEPMVIAGQGTCGLEIAEQAKTAGLGEDVDVLVCCGGGGLTSGVAVALASVAPGMRVRPVEPRGFDDVARSQIAGHRQKNPDVSGSVCDAIMTPEPGEITFPLIQRFCAPGLVVPDDEALWALVQAFLRLKIVIEPGGAVALAAALLQGDAIAGDAVIVIATGGNVDPDFFATTLGTEKYVAPWVG